MRRSFRSFLTPGWAGLTVFAWAAAVGMVLLGRWQLIVSDERHFDLQNFGYALQWWAFSAFAVGFWGKLVRDAWRGRQPSNELSGGLPVLRESGGGALVGPAQLLATTDAGGETPIVYRGYVMPQSATSPDRSDDDRMRASYNDYLWELAMADSAAGTGRATSRADLSRADADVPGHSSGAPRIDADGAPAHKMLGGDASGAIPPCTPTGPLAQTASEPLAQAAEPPTVVLPASPALERGMGDRHRSGLDDADADGSRQPG